MSSIPSPLAPADPFDINTGDLEIMDSLGLGDIGTTSYSDTPLIGGGNADADSLLVTQPVGSESSALQLPSDVDPLAGYGITTPSSQIAQAEAQAGQSSTPWYIALGQSIGQGITTGLKAAVGSAVESLLSERVIAVVIGVLCILGGVWALLDEGRGVSMPADPQTARLKTASNRASAEAAEAAEIAA